MFQELVPHPDVVVRAFDESRQIRHDDLPIIGERQMSKILKRDDIKIYLYSASYKVKTPKANSTNRITYLGDYYFN